MTIKRFTGKITGIKDLSKTAKEVSLKLSEPIGFIAGSFVNVFMDINGEKVRRAYSISSSSEDQENITLTLRLTPDGEMTPVFWNKDMTGETLELMGPLGLNTADKMKSDKIYLFAFGVGAGVVKSLADHFSRMGESTKLTIVTGSKYEDEILYKEYFDGLARNLKNVSVAHVISRAEPGQGVLRGHIQDHIENFDFNGADVYVCGAGMACGELAKKITSMGPANCNFFVEGFH